MITIKETAGDTLVGAIDGTNIEFYTSFPFVPETVQVFWNGRLKVRDWDDGFTIQSPTKVVLKEAPLPGDSLEIEYESGTRTGGGADGGCPDAPKITIIQPGTISGEDTPGMISEKLSAKLAAPGNTPPATASSSDRPSLF
jgi:hypothetical protein